ncbi:MAG: Bug family tripartite tricarboxylate transporter substrate binding protein [Burkholderiales bacterium]
MQTTLSRVKVRQFVLMIGAVFALGVAWNAESLAQSYPARSVRIVIGITAGGLSDTFARAMAFELSKRWGQAVVVENRPGGAGVIAADAVAKSPPDGHALFQTDSIQWVTNLLLNRNLPYDPIKDFAPVAGLTRTHSLLVSNVKLPLKSVNELIAAAREKPGRLNYGSFGVGSAAHLNAESFSSVYGLRMTHIPYKGGVDIMKALLTGEVDMAFTGAIAAIPFVRQGQIRALAYSGGQRSPAMPEVPTFAELALKEMQVGSWFGWLAPGLTPPAVLDRIAADARQVVAIPEFAEKFVMAPGMEVMDMPRLAFAELLRTDREKYGSLVKSINLKLD